jgi:hypothetical protein
MNTNMQKPTPGLTSEVYALIQANEHLLSRPKQVFQRDEMNQLYKIYNAYHGENKQDSGCGACRTTTVNKVRKIYEEYKKTI